MQFRTEIPILKSKNPIGYDTEIFSIGSCFAVNIAEKLDYYKFCNASNPFGILFHPPAILEIIRKTVLQEFFKEDDLFFHNELWHCFSIHSELSHPNKEIMLQNLNNLLVETHRNLTKATHIIITYGTSWFYQHIPSGKFVANCHKVPQSQFEKKIFAVEMLQSAIAETINLIRKVNNNASIIFTISPVRHVKDGFAENQRSKAHLITALHHEFESNAKCSYFPSYEIMMDELRDYRFYAQDMLHPNEIAIEFIWQRFSDSTISPESQMVMEEINYIQKSLLHKPFHPKSATHLLFKSKLHDRIAALQKQFPRIKF